MGKITETLYNIQSGARSNKYRVFYPLFGRDIDIACHATSSPGREIGTVEVYIKGRKYQLAAESTDDGTWEMTIYNTPDLFHRRFFLKMLQGLHNFDAPRYLTSPGGVETSLLNENNNLDAFSDAVSQGGSGISGFINSLSSTVSQIDQAYTSVRDTFGVVAGLSRTVMEAINGDWTAVENMLYQNNYGRPWYMQEIVIEQLDHNENATTNTTLHNCFVTGVSAIEYTDEIGDISTTTITFAYSGITFDGAPFAI